MNEPTKTENPQIIEDVLMLDELSIVLLHLVALPG